jgi:hypothetical protein
MNTFLALLCLLGFLLVLGGIIGGLVLGADRLAAKYREYLKKAAAEAAKESSAHGGVEHEPMHKEKVRVAAAPELEGIDIYQPGWAQGLGKKHHKDN